MAVRDFAAIVGWADQREAHRNPLNLNPSPAPFGGLPVGQPTLRGWSLHNRARSISYTGQRSWGYGLALKRGQRRANLGRGEKYALLVQEERCCDVRFERMPKP